MFGWLKKLFAPKPPAEPPMRDAELIASVNTAYRYHNALRHDLAKLRPSALHQWRQLSLFMVGLFEAINQFQQLEKNLRQYNDSPDRRDGPYENLHLKQNPNYPSNYGSRNFITPFENMTIGLSVSHDAFGGWYRNGQWTVNLTIAVAGEQVYYFYGTVDKDESKSDLNLFKVSTEVPQIDIAAPIIRYFAAITQAMGEDLTRLHAEARHADRLKSEKFVNMFSPTQ